MRALSGRRLSRNTELLAMLADKMSNLVWMLSKDGKTGSNPPQSIYRLLTDPEAVTREKDKNRPVAFESGEDLDAALARIREAASRKQQKGGT